MRFHSLLVFLAASLSLFILPTTPLHADFYKWVDENGVAHFSDQPPASAGINRQVESMPSVSPATGQPTPSAAKAAARPKTAAESAPAGKQAPAVKPARPAVELYVTSWCKYCKQAKAYLAAKKIPFRVYDIEKDRQAAARRRQLDPRPGVPLAVINGRIILGFSQAAYDAALAAGNK